MQLITPQNLQIVFNQLAAPTYPAHGFIQKFWNDRIVNQASGVDRLLESTRNMYRYFKASAPQHADAHVATQAIQYSLIFATITYFDKDPGLSSQLRVALPQWYAENRHHMDSIIPAITQFLTANKPMTPASSSVFSMDDLAEWVVDIPVASPTVTVNPLDSIYAIPEVTTLGTATVEDVDWDNIDPFTGKPYPATKPVEVPVTVTDVEVLPKDVPITPVADTVDDAEYTEEDGIVDFVNLGEEIRPLDSTDFDRFIQSHIPTPDDTVYPDQLAFVPPQVINPFTHTVIGKEVLELDVNAHNRVRQIVPTRPAGQADDFFGVYATTEGINTVTVADTIDCVEPAQTGFGVKTRYVELVNPIVSTSVEHAVEILNVNRPSIKDDTVYIANVTVIEQLISGDDTETLETYLIETMLNELVGIDESEKLMNVHQMLVNVKTNLLDALTPDAEALAVLARIDRRLTDRFNVLVRYGLKVDVVMTSFIDEFKHVIDELFQNPTVDATGVVELFETVYASYLITDALTLYNGLATDLDKTWRKITNGNTRKRSVGLYRAIEEVLVKVPVSIANFNMHMAAPRAVVSQDYMPQFRTWLLDIFDYTKAMSITVVTADNVKLIVDYVQLGSSDVELVVRLY